MLTNYYEILEINSNATDEQIKKAFRQKAIKYHPDKNFGNPEFNEKFINVKSAYDILIDHELRKVFDSKYNIEIGNLNQPKPNEQSQKNNQEENVKFTFNSQAKFYSSSDREIQDTPQVPPIQTPWGDLINRQTFFKLPKKIGKLIGGYSTYFEDKPKTSIFDYIKLCLKKSLSLAIIVGVVIGVIFLGNIINSNFEHIYRIGRIAIIIFSTVYTIGLLIIFSVHNNLLKYQNLNYYVGINGFAYFISEGEIENIIQEREINFQSITHLYSVEVENHENGSYKGTIYSFTWINYISKDIIYKCDGSYYLKGGEPSKDVSYYYWMNRFAENAWTIYLMDQMESELSRKGFLQFDLMLNNNYKETIPYIRLEVNRITFLQIDKYSYNISEIKRFYRKNQNLYFEHVNYNKTFKFFESGNRNYIPLNLISNKLFLIKALELLLGFKI